MVFLEVLVQVSSWKGNGALGALLWPHHHKTNYGSRAHAGSTCRFQMSPPLFLPLLVSRDRFHKHSESITLTHGFWERNIRTRRVPNLIVWPGD